MFYDLKSLLTSFLTSDNDWRKMLLQQWPDIIGQLHDKIRLEKIYDDHIVIGVYDHHWMHELYHMSRLILHTINQRLDRPRVKRIRFVLVSLKTKKVSQENKQETHVATRSTKLTIHQQKALNVIADPELRRVLVMFVKCINK